MPRAALPKSAGLVQVPSFTPLKRTQYPKANDLSSPGLQKQFPLKSRWRRAFDREVSS